MRTQSHFLITGFIWDILNHRDPPVRTGRAFLVGSVLPDVPLMILTTWYLVHRLQSENPPSDESPFYGPEYDDYFFHNPTWIFLTSLFHAPFFIAIYAFIGAVAWMLSCCWGEPLMWFSASCGFNAFIDAITHVEDGLLVFYPFNTHYRLEGWISYYDPSYGGHEFTMFEYILDALLISYFVYRAVQSSLSHKRMARYMQVNQSVIDNPIV